MAGARYLRSIVPKRGKRDRVPSPRSCPGRGDLIILRIDDATTKTWSGERDSRDRARRSSALPPGGWVSETRHRAACSPAQDYQFRGRLGARRCSMLSTRPVNASRRWLADAAAADADCASAPAACAAAPAASALPLPCCPVASSELMRVSPAAICSSTYSVVAHPLRPNPANIAAAARLNLSEDMFLLPVARGFVRYPSRL